LSDPEPSALPTATPDYRATSRWNVVWFVPILALLIGGWMIWRNFSSQGPLAYVRFETADGLTAKKTEVRCRSVRVGVVKEVKLAEDFKTVITLIELFPDSGIQLRRDTSFWVVRPRVSTASGVSGLDTLITGAYIELNPGSPGGEVVNHFEGLENPPATSKDILGRRIVLTTDEAGSLTAGSPIYYRGFEVGRIESRTLDLDPQGKMQVRFDAFIQDKYSSLVLDTTRFWNTSGIDVSAGADGLKLRTPSFQAMVSGGATFGPPKGIETGKPIIDGAVFTLFKGQDEAEKSAFNPTSKFVLLFDQSVRGLNKSAPVEFRGIPIGRVADISLDYLPADNTSTCIPVLIEIDPALLRREATGKTDDSDSEYLAAAVKRGLRATLTPGSLLTGALFVAIDFFPEAKPDELVQVGEYPSIPTVLSGLQHQLTTALNKFQSLPVEESLKKFDTATTQIALALEEIKATAAAANKLLASDEIAKLPADLRASLAKIDKLAASLDQAVVSYGPQGPLQGDMLRTLDEVRAAVRSLKSLTSAIEEQPNSLLIGRGGSGSTVPKAPKASKPNR
jgi:paraquat-inducible protein B